MANWREHISIDPAIHHGDPCIKGTRVPISVIVGSVADGDSVEKILGAYSGLTQQDIQAALRFAADKGAALSVTKTYRATDGSVSWRGYLAHPVRHEVREQLLVELSQIDR